MPKKTSRPRKMTKPRKKTSPITLIELAERRIRAWKRNPIRDSEEVRRMYGDEFGAETDILDLSNLELRALPESLRQLHNLELLVLRRNKLSKLPEWFGELTSLKALVLAENRLTSLPEEISECQNLVFLRVEDNELEDLPEGIRALPLKYLKVEGNPKLRLPVSIIERRRRPEEILRYYFESRDEKGQPLLELKLLLVGRGKAGKTTLVKQLAGERPSTNESETHSIAIRELILKCHRGQVRTRAWDFGGQEILHSTHQFFLTERSLYLLVLEPRTGLAQRDAEYWLKLIETQGGNSPVVVVMNWSSGRGWHVDEVKLRRKFPFIVDFVQTDALNGEGIDELRTRINQAVEEHMSDVWLPFPVRWRGIKNTVAGMTDNFLTYKQYVQLCEKHGETDSAAQADLAAILHALGLALYFGNDPRLHDTRVLNPSWVTGGVYSVIRAASVMKNEGQLVLDDMSRVLLEAEQERVVNAKDYPPATHRFILELMRAFQLCYASEDEKGKPTRYLVPELLPEFEPSMDEKWEGNADVRLRYRYEVLPPGLLPRFIVRTHALSDGEPHWRHGVVLRHADAKSLIREETDRPELQVFILGGNEETRRLLVAMVRRELQLLHDEMKMQPVEELELSGKSERWIGVRALQEIEEPKKTKQRLPVQPEGTAEVNVSRELNKLLPAAARAIDRDPTNAPLPVRLFVSYAHDDERQLKRLDAMLDVLEQLHGLASWVDKRLIAGEEWDAEIRRRLEQMDIFLFIASQTSLVRPYIKDPELLRARERRDAGEIEIVAVKLEPCAVDEDPFLGKLQRLAPKFASVAEAPLKSGAWEQIRKDLLPVIKRVRTRKENAIPREPASDKSGFDNWAL
jgi:internalin A